MKRPPAKQPQALLTDLYLGLLFTVFLLWPGTRGYPAIQQAKTQAYRWLTGGYVLCLALLWLELLLIGRQKLPKPAQLLKNSSWPQRLVALYWGLTALSTLLSPYRQEALLGMTRDEGLLTITLYCLSFLCLSALARPGRWLGWLLAGTMTIFDGICLLQMAGYNPLSLFADGLTYQDANLRYAGIFLGPAGNAGLTAGLLCLTTPLLLGLAHTGRGKARLLALIPAGLNLWVTVQSGIRAGLVGLSAGLALSLPVLLPPGKKRTYARYAIAAALCAGLLLLWLYPGTSGTLYEASQLLHGNFDPDFGNGRIHIWRQVLERAPQRLWTGFGPDTMAAESISGLPWRNYDTGQLMHLMVDTAHNDYLNILFHQGVPGLAVYLAALAWTAARWLGTRRRETAWLGAGILCYCIQICFSFSMAAAAGPFWALWGLLEGPLRKTEEVT